MRDDANGEGGTRARRRLTRTRDDAVVTTRGVRACAVKDHDE